VRQGRREPKHKCPHQLLPPQTIALLPQESEKMIKTILLTVLFIGAAITPAVSQHYFTNLGYDPQDVARAEAFFPLQPEKQREYLIQHGRTVSPAQQQAAPRVEAQEVSGCRNAWNDLNVRGALRDARTLIGTDCPVMYRQGWLMNASNPTSDVIPRCETAWNTLASKGALGSAQFLVMHNCPVIQRNGWRH
jgi:hypothetical protein